MKLHEKIKFLRKQKGISQAELARIIGIHTAHVSRLETGKYAPSVDVLKKLSEALETTTDNLLSEDDLNTTNVRIEDKTLFERVKLIETLDSEEKQAIIKIIDSMLTKKKVTDLLTKQVS